MNDAFSLSAGGFTTQVRFFTEPATLLDGTDLHLFDTHTAPLFAEAGVPRHVWPAGEDAKTWPQIDAALSRGLDLGLGRDSTWAGVGGGVVTDMAAFAASLYMRGVGLVLVPTTLLAMVDAALGGKTGIDYHGLKNLVGTFYPARELRLCPPLLGTLPERDFRSGLAEVIKHAFLADADLLHLLETRADSVLARDADCLHELVLRAVKVKAGIVERDFRETGERAHLNLGHTFGHALEAAMGFDGSWTHGEAVAWGMGRALDLGLALGLTDPSWRQRALALLVRYGFRLEAPGADPEVLLRAMTHDKKKAGGRVRFVLQKAQGQTLVVPAEEAQVRASLEGGLRTP